MRSQTSLFAAENEERRKAAMDAIDKINNECGNPVLKPAVLCETPEEEKSGEANLVIVKTLCRLHHQALSR